MVYPYYPNYYNANGGNLMQYQSAQQQNSGIIWVQGIEAAKSYLVGAGQSVLLMDSETSTFYIKSTDPSGMPLPIRVFEYTEKVQQPVGSASAAPDMTQYVTRDELQRFAEELKSQMKGA
jgi:hypothetical protein